jgi:hypothetical protein
VFGPIFDQFAFLFIPQGDVELMGGGMRLRLTPCFPHYLPISLSKVWKFLVSDYVIGKVKFG